MAGKSTSVERVELTELESGQAGGPSLWGGNLDVIKNVKVKLEVVLGNTELSVADLLALTAKSVIALDRDASHPVDLRLDGKVVGRGRLVVVGDSFGLQLTEINSQPT